MSRRYYLSRFPPEECRRRVEAATKPDTFYNRCYEDSSGPEVLAKFSETGFRLVYLLGPAQVLYGEFSPISDGSMVATEVRSYPQSWIFPVIFLTALLLLGGREWVLGVLELLRGQRSLDDAWTAVLLLPFLLLVSALWLLDSEPGRKKLLGFVEEVLEARQIVAHVITV